MTEPEARDQILELLTTIVKGLAADGGWVPLETYLSWYKGETRAAVHSRRHRGDWKDGVECKVVQGGRLWVNVLAVNAWVSKAKCESRRGSTRDTEKTDAAASGSSSCSGGSPAASH